MQLSIDKDFLLYLINPDPPYQFAAQGTLLIIFAVAMAAAVFASLYRWQPWQQKFKTSLAAPLWILSLVGFFLIFARSQSINYLAMPLWLALLILASFLWIAYSLGIAYRNLPRAKENYLKHVRFTSYLPKPKRAAENHKRK